MLVYVGLSHECIPPIAYDCCQIKIDMKHEESSCRSLIPNIPKNQVFEKIDIYLPKPVPPPLKSPQEFSNFTNSTLNKSILIGCDITNK